MSKPVPSLKTKRLLLRPITLEDAIGYSKYFVDYEVIRHLSSVVPWPYPKDGVTDYLKTMILPAQGIDRWAWGIFLQKNPSEIIGCIDLWRKGCPENRGFWLGKAFWGQGLMTEAAMAVTDFAFQELGFEKLIFSNAVGNTRSRRVKEKTGAHLLGTRPAKFVDPSLIEAETWELTKDEWQNVRSVQ
jgi:RimJ/RimL family protein N-acetyltransferase